MRVLLRVPRVTRSPSERGLPGNGRLADWEPCGTGSLCVFTLIASMCHMYLERCRNNNPKQQEGRLHFRGAAASGNTASSTQAPGARASGLEAEWGPGPGCSGQARTSPRGPAPEDRSPLLVGDDKVLEFQWRGSGECSLSYSRQTVWVGEEFRRK